MAKEIAKDETVQEAATFSAAEIAANAPQLFGYSRDIATAALAFNHVEQASIEEARKVIKGFAERKVD